MQCLKNNKFFQYKTQFYVFSGGFNGSTRLSSGERYNPKTNTWTLIPDMYNPRSNFALEVSHIDTFLYS